MIVYASRPNYDVPTGAREHVRAYRRALKVSRSSVALCDEFLSASTDRWSPLATGYRSIDVTRHWCWGGNHVYYDGPHCSFSLGFLHFNWSTGWCKKCAAEA